MAKRRSVGQLRLQSTRTQPITHFAAKRLQELACSGLPSFSCRPQKEHESLLARTKNKDEELTYVGLLCVAHALLCCCPLLAHVVQG